MSKNYLSFYLQTCPILSAILYRCEAWLKLNLKSVESLCTTGVISLLRVRLATPNLTLLPGFWPRWSSTVAWFMTFWGMFLKLGVKRTKLWTHIYLTSWRIKIIFGVTTWRLFRNYDLIGNKIQDSSNTPYIEDFLRITFTFMVILSQTASGNGKVESNTTHYITPDLRSLHWLPVSQRTDFKILLLVCKALNGLWPKYITDLLQKLWTVQTTQIVWFTVCPYT